METAINSKKTVSNIVKVSLSNFIKLFAGVLAGFLLPKIFGVTDYGYYKTFTLYITYTAILHFGIIDGIYLLFAGKKYDELDKGKFRFYSRFLIISESALSFIFFLVAFFFLKNDSKVIFIFVSIYILSNNITGYYQIISQITSRFNELTIRNILQSGIQSLIVVLLFAFYKFGVVEVRYYHYLIGYISMCFLLMCWYIYTYRDITFGKATKEHSFLDILYFSKIGVPLLIANICSTIILTIDRQFVNSFFDIDIYSIYAFSYNLMSLITAVISAISVVLYPSLKQMDKKTLNQSYSKLLLVILFFSFGGIAVYFPLVPFINTFLPKYGDSLLIFRIILPSIAISSPITVVMHNYYKTIGKNNTFFALSIFILLLSICLNFLAYYLFKTTESISIASVCTIFVWYLVCGFYFVKNYKIKFIKRLLYIVSMTLGFYIISFAISSWVRGFVLYLALYFLLTMLFYSKDIEFILSKRSEKKI